jgi:hypothetical protein
MSRRRRQRSVQLPCTLGCRIEIQIQAKNFPYLETAHLLEMPMAIDMHVLPRPLPRMDLYFDGTRVTRSFAAFGGSYAPGTVDRDIFAGKIF